MDIWKVNRMQGDFTQVYNEPFRNKELSLKARGFLATLLTLPDGWDFSVTGMATILKEGESAIRAAISELMDQGYCQRTRLTDPTTGRVTGWHYDFFESAQIPAPDTCEPHRGFPQVENPQVENQGQYNTISNQENKNKDNTPLYISPRFKKPTFEEVRIYCIERGNGIDAQRFIDYYESNGWKVGRTPMKDWKAAVRNWEGRRKQEGTRKPGEKPLTGYNAIIEQGKRLGYFGSVLGSTGGQDYDEQ